MIFTFKTAATVAALCLFSTASLASTIVVNLDTPISTDDAGPTVVDVDEDGLFDLVLEIQSFDGIEAGVVNGVLQDSVFDGGFGAPRGDVGSFTMVSASVLVDSNDDLISIAAGTSVNASTADALGGIWGTFGFAYGNIFNAGSTDLLAGTSDTAFIGVRIDVDTFGIDETIATETTFAWVEVERGSLIVNSFGYGNGSGVAAATPGVSPVPLPAGLPLLLAGLGAFGLVKRRKSPTV